jgi:regulator of sigma E protease
VIFSVAAAVVAASTALGSGFSIVKVVLGFGLVIFLHEFGHFLMARRNGVFVEKFAIGFDFWGLKLYSWHRGGTEYVIGAFPVGGYVKMLGQHDFPEDAEKAGRDPRSFQSKSVLARTQIISAGVIANFLSAFALCYLALVVGYHSYPSEVGSVSFASLEAGLRPGDIVTQVGGKNVSSWEEIVVRFATLEEGTRVELTVERDGAPVRVRVPVHRYPDAEINTPDFGGAVELRVGSLAAGLPAELAGVQLGDLLTAVDGEAVRNWSHFQEQIRQRADTPSTLTVQRDGAPVELKVTPASRRPSEVPEYFLGAWPDQPPTLDYVEENSPAWVAGLRAGDVAVAVDGEPVGTWYEVYRAVTWRSEPASPTTFSVTRAGSPVQAVVTPGPIEDWGMTIDALPTVGIAHNTPEGLTIGRVDPNSPAAKTGIRTGDVVTRIKGHVAPIGAEPQDWETRRPSWAGLLATLNTVDNERVELDVERDGKTHTFQVELTKDPRKVAIGYLGVGPLTKEQLVQKGPIEAIGVAAVAPFRILKEFIDGLRAMFLRRVSTKMLAGPVGILQATYHFAEKSTGDLLNFLALLSVNLAVVNFLPIPITDGGHFMFLMYEKFKGERMDEELEARFQWAGLVFILLVFLFATFNDVGRLFDF